MKRKEDILWRVRIIYFLLMIFAGIIFVKIFYLQFVEGSKYRSKAKDNQYKKIEISADRGNICACDGRLLAGSVPFFEIRMDAKVCPDSVFNKKLDSLALCLAQFYGDKSRWYYKDIIRTARLRNNRYLLINSKELTYDELKRVRTFPIFRLGKNRGGLIANKINKRLLPHGNLASRTIGYISESEYSGVEGRVGLEGAYETYLKGKPGQGIKQKMIGKWLPFTTVEPIDGYDIITTIDVDFQDVVHTELENQLKKYNAENGTAVLMEVSTGEVKAIANLGRDSINDCYVEDYNYAVGESDEYGSVFKLASMIALLEDGYVTPNDSVNTGDGTCVFYDRVMKDSHRGGFGKITVREVFEKSSNVGISKLVNKYYGNNPSRYVNRLYSMKLNESLGVEIKGEGTPVIKYPGDSDWYGTTLPWMSIGYEISMTPLQILNLFNSVANDGRMVRPKFVKELRYRGKTVKRINKEIVSPMICSESTLNVVQSMLEGVVERGTARNIKSDDYKIAGKTGTALIAESGKGYINKIYRGSFAGYFPADRPMYSCIVVINNPQRSKGYYGSIVAAPVFKAIADRVYAMTYSLNGENRECEKEKQRLPDFANGYSKDIDVLAGELGYDINIKEGEEWVRTVSKDSVVDYKRLNLLKNKVPNVVGMGLRDALFLLENSGLIVKYRGRGKVVKQSLEPGRKIGRGYTIYLLLR